MTLGAWVCVAVGAFVGGTTRYALTTALRRGRRLGDATGTTVVNVLGSFLLGLLAHLVARKVVGLTPYALLGLGFCGALTTWSTLARGVAERILDRNTGDAAAYLAVSLLVGLGATTLGWQLGG